MAMMLCSMIDDHVLNSKIDVHVQCSMINGYDAVLKIGMKVKIVTIFR